jgi:hypothetical protein
MHPSEEKWEIHKNKPRWDLNSLCVAVNYAADRILDRVTFDMRTEDHQGIFQNTQEAVDQLKLVIGQIWDIESWEKYKEVHTVPRLHEIANLYSTMSRALVGVYKVSFICLPHALTRTGMHGSAEWRMAFQDHQAVISSATRYIKNVYVDEIAAAIDMLSHKKTNTTNYDKDQNGISSAQIDAVCKNVCHALISAEKRNDEDAGIDDSQQQKSGEGDESLYNTETEEITRARMLLETVVANMKCYQQAIVELDKTDTTNYDDDQITAHGSLVEGWYEQLEKARAEHTRISAAIVKLRYGLTHNRYQ